MLDFARKRIIARFAAQFQERLEHTILGAAEQGSMFPEGKSKPAVGLDEADVLRGFFHSGGLISVMDLIWTPMFVAVVFVLHPILGYVCLAGLIAMVTLVAIRLGFVGGRQDRNKDCSNRIGELKKMVIASRETVRGQGMSTGYKDRWMRAREDSRDSAIALRDWVAWFDQLSSTTLLVTRYAVLASGAYLVLEGKLTVGAMVACAFLVTRVLVPVNTFASTVPAIFEALSNWRRLKNILAKWDVATSEPFLTAPPNKRVRLSLRGVSVKSPLDGTMVVRQATMQLAPGSLTQVCGTSGQGKSVLAKAICGIARTTSGTITLDGANVARMTDAELGAAIGYVPQNPRFIAGTIAENISRLDPEITPEKVSKAARKVCLHGWISQLPQGYQTVLDPCASTLSQGQRQQLSWARALYHEPKVLVLDEPDRMLFERLPETMDKLMDGLLKQGTVVLALARNSLNLEYDYLHFNLANGRLGESKRVRAQNLNRAKPASTKPPSKVAVLSETTALAGNA
ncbi:ATP-binding cassette domain-containing protein [Sulfitobacter sp. PS-8MA]|uniref:ATP-binding cassette domain-containing protein n=1 Tax=Sulfitobacter sp. PS-8MA TaxID=3237707 RepID=UPI0034C6DDFC